ncbi:hypothetical protein B0H10DRAFT_1031606 [Mycena sp. CBHHK59/15]|nr:hypothetical protein B0H10DRAFT_1031606 [Mycena sp. CBHHK59/15]
MHATLKIERLQELPPSYRRVATAAVSGSLTDLWKFIEFIAAKPYHRPDLVVPALLANLQPARIPDPDHLAEMAPDRNSPMRRAVIALCELVMRNHIEKLPLAAYADVWGLIWPWFHFMDTYRESLEQFDLLNEIYPILVSAISCLGFDVATLALINTTPGVRVLIVRAWSMFLQESELSSVHGFVRLCCVPLDLDAPNATQLEELCEGAGGTLTDLAMLAVKHLQCVLRPEFPAFGKTEMFLHGVLTLLHNADQGVNPFGAELVAQGIMTVYTAILCSIGGDTGAELALLAYRCFIHLLHHIAACSGHLWMIEVLDAGLLRAIALHSTIRNQNKEMIKGLQTLLRHVLPGCMVYRSVLLRMNDAFIVAKELAGTDDFLASEIFADWENICELVESRLEMLEEYEQGNYSSNVACDNLEACYYYPLFRRSILISNQCPQILPKRDFRRCSGCQQSYYCSHDCQKVDWQHGGHKEDCQRLRDLRIRTSSSVHGYQGVQE